MLSDEEKEELFSDFMVRMAELDKEDKKVSSALNRSAMKDISSYWALTIGTERNKSNEWLYRRDETGWWYRSGDGLYNAYLALRKAVPFIVGAKRSLDSNDYIHSGYGKNYVMDPDKDREEAYKIGKLLIDSMIRYLKGDDR